MDMKKSSKVSSWRRGWVVFAVLVVLTAVEFAISLGINNPWPLLTVVALAKGALIVNYFMRVMDLKILWRKESPE